MGSGKKKKYKTGLVLSGGGTRGFAHLGVLKALAENGIKPDVISGVSAGSIVGALYADGNDAEEALKALTSQNLLGFLNFMIPNGGLVKMTGFETVLKKTLKSRKIEELDIPLIIHAVNINTAEYTAFEKGDLVEIIKASSSMPVVFPPVKIGNDYFLDGGIINNFPVEPLEGICETIIGVNVNPIGEIRNLDSLKKIAIRSFQISIRKHAYDRKDRCDIYIEPEGLNKYGLLDISNAKEIFRMGYETTLKELKKKN